MSLDKDQRCTISGEQLSSDKKGEFNIKACWSKAGVGTCIVLEQTSMSKKKMRLVFDLGWLVSCDNTD